jgi:lipopolysaccharide/colanic/teichoic acid biosynthesis glycosyltransferase/RimJ/RimL family protein N-acetyltransferase
MLHVPSEAEPSGDRAKQQLVVALKRVIDTILVLLASPLWLPLTLAAGAAVFLSMGRPVIYRQRRIGLGEKEFEILKFRTMTNGTEPSGQPLPDALRLTRTGRFLRKLSLDEIPQLLNVLHGDMALVGPRPLYPDYLPFYSRRERLRHTVRPGITGAAQVEGRNLLLWTDRLELDARYAEDLSLRADFLILAKTFVRVSGGDGVAVVAGESGEPLHVARSYPTHHGFTMRRFEYADIPHRVRWMHDARIRRHMNLPENVSEDSTTSWLRNARTTPGRHDFTVTAVGSDRPVAMLGLTPTPHTLPELYIFVDPDRLGQGVGSAAMSIVIAWMGRTGLPGCRLTVAASNVAAVALYRRIGFAVVGDPTSARLQMEYRSVAQEAP